MKLIQLGLVAGVLGLGLGLSGCATATIALKEKFGYAKREQLVSAVKDVRDAQQDAKKQFASALDQFIAVTGSKGGDLEAKYRKLQSEYDRSVSRAEAVRSEIKDVDNVSNSLFKEWREELSKYNDARLRADSERQLEDTRRQYDKLYDTMKAAESRMQPVLNAFSDQVLYLKHNLNAQAIAGLQGNVERIQMDVSNLIREMEASIAESNAFISQMKTN